jgi:hypothetical protein
MIRSTVLCTILLATAACGDKTQTTTLPAAPSPPPAAATPELSAPPVNDAAIVCQDAEYPRTVFQVELNYPEGCTPIPTEYEGQAHELEISLEGSPLTAYFIEPVDLQFQAVKIVSEGCAVAIKYSSAIGTLDINLAATEDRAAAGTGHWEPAPGTGKGCDLPLTAEINRHTGPS